MSSESHNYTLAAPRDVVSVLLRSAVEAIEIADQFEVINLDLPDLSIHFVVLEEIKNG